MKNNTFTDTEEWFNYKEFYDFISSKNFLTLVEVGVWKGSSISYLASKNKNSKIFAVDLFENTYRYKKGYLRQEALTVYDTYNNQLLKTNTRDIITDIRDYSWDGATKFDDNSLDFVFIDADHSYESVKKDLEAWFPKMKKGSIFSGHDYESYNDQCHPGVKQAVDEFCNLNNLKLQTYAGCVWYVAL
jgi:predicted O-methyltransferase YrrM